MKDHGWQEAFEAIYPLKINEIRVTRRDGDLRRRGPFSRSRSADSPSGAENIRNIRSKERTYPSDLHLEAVVFGTRPHRGRRPCRLPGRAHPGPAGGRTLAGQIALDYFKPVLNHGSVAIQGGHLAAAGSFEWGPTVRIADLKQATISGMTVEYVQTPQTAGVPQKAARKTEKAVQQANNAPDLLLRARAGRARRQPRRVLQHADDAGLSRLHRRRRGCGSRISRTRPPRDR